MLGRVFENLLAEINPETQESARKSTGAFYTPREIVDYMVVESLKKYLHNHIKIKPSRLSALFSTVQDDDLSPTEKKSIMEALDKLTILDPACGSGAFPMGLLQRLFDLKQKLQHSPSCYELKLDILRKSIFGVDIQPIAVEISRLRAFLSIVLEESLDKNQPNLGIKPLPNLEFNFIIANSLVGLEYDVDGSMKGYLLKGFCDQIAQISQIFFSADTPAKKDQARQRFEAFAESVKNVDRSLVSKEEIEMLRSYNPFKNTPALFFEPHIQFGLEGNFGIVIGNPPYVQLQKLPNNATELYQKQKFDSYTRSGDLYQLFYERSLNLLNPQGVATLITSNKWLRAGYGISSRLFFHREAEVYGLLDLGSSRFESATVDTNILFYGRKPEHVLQPSAPAIDYANKPITSIPSLDEDERFDSLSISSEGDAWIVLNRAEASILEKIKKAGKPLKDWDISINRGVLTGFNEAFVIDGATKDALIKEDPKSAEIIKPLLRGRDIKRYSMKFADQWLIGTLPALHLDIDKYPAIKKYLEDFRPRIDQTGEKGSRKKTTHQWFETQDTIAYYKDFAKPKIVWQRITDKNKFVLSPAGQYILDSMAFFCDFTERQGLYLLGLANSSLIYYWVKKNVHEYGSTGFRLANQYVELFPIPVPTPEQESTITGLVDKILAGKQAGKDTLALEAQIDSIVYGLYGLTNDEISVVEAKK